jgi:hypothetical protein
LRKRVPQISERLAVRPVCGPFHVNPLPRPRRCAVYSPPRVRPAGRHRLMSYCEGSTSRDNVASIADFLRCTTGTVAQSPSRSH